MASYGSLIYYTKNGVSEPFSLCYGKTTIGSSDSHHIRIKGEGQITCTLDSNEVGVTILVNENEDENIIINNEPTKKYTVLKDGDHLEIGKKKFKYSNPSLNEEHLEQTQQTLNKKVGTVRKPETLLKTPTTPLKRLQKDVTLSKQRRFSTGSKLAPVRNSPRMIRKGLSPSRHTSTPQSPSTARFSRRMVSRRNSTLASVMENEVFDFQSPKATPVKKTVARSSFLASGGSPSFKKNKTFAGTSDFSSPVPPKNKTYSGNISDVSDNFTTPENSVNVASITPLNVSKKAKKSMNTSRTLSYVDLPSSSTPKSAMKMSRSSSLYRPLVEDITPASPLPRSSLRNSSLNKHAFTQRRSVNFNISSSSDLSSRPDSALINELNASSTGGKRKRNIETDDDILETSGSSKKRRSNSTRASLDNVNENQNSPRNSSISGIQNLSNASYSKNELSNVSTSSRSRRNISLKHQEDSETFSIVSWNVEVSSTDMNISGLSEISSVAETPQKSKRSIRFSNSLASGGSAGKFRQSAVSTTPRSLDLEESQHSERFLENVSPNMEAILDDSLEDSSETSKSASSKSRRSSTMTQNKAKGKIRSKSLNLKRETPQSGKKLSKTMGNNSPFGISEQGLRNISSTPTVPTKSSRVSAKRKSSISKPLSRSLNMGYKPSYSPHDQSKASTSMTLAFSPIVSIAQGDFSEDSPSASTRSRRSTVQNEVKGKARSKSLNLSRNTRKSNDKHSKTLGSNMKLNTPERMSLGNLSSSFTSKSEPRNVSPKRKSLVSKPRSQSLNVRDNVSNSPHIPSKMSISMAVNFSPNSANLDLSAEHDFNDSGSLMSAVSATSSMFLDSMSELDSSTKRLSKSMNVSNLSKIGSAKKTPMIMITRDSSINTRTESPASSRMSSRNRSRLVSGDLSEFCSISSNGSFSNSSLNSVGLDKTDSTTPEALFKTPTVKRAPRRLIETPNLSFESTSEPASAKSVGSSRRSIRSSILPESSFSDVDDKESVETSLSRSWKSLESESVASASNLSIGTRSAKVTPKNIRNSTKQQKTPIKDLTEIAAVEELLKTPNNDSGNIAVKKLNLTPRVKNSPKNDLSDVGGVKSLRKTPRVQKSPKNDLTAVVGLKKLLKTPSVQQPPKNDLSDVRGVKRLLKTPKVQSSPRNDLSNIAGVKKLLKTPKGQKSPENDLSNVGGVKKLMKTPKVQNPPKNDLTNVGGVKKLMKTPKVQNPPKNDLTNVGGVKQLMKTPKVQNSPKNDLTNVGGVKKLMKTPKVQKSPKNDLTNVKGVKKLMKSSKVQNSPKNDLTNVGGVKKLMRTPKLQKSPKNDLTNVGGVKKLMTTPKLQKSPKNDLSKVSGLKKLMASPRNVKGTKKILKTPRVQKSPKNDLLDVRGIRNLLRTPKNKPADESHDLSGIDILFNESQESNFDKLLDKKVLRTYRGSSKANTSQEDKPKTPEHVLKWIEDQREIEPTIQVTESIKGKRKLAETSITPNKRQKVTGSARANKDESMLNISSALLEKPSSTPNLQNKTTRHTSKAELSESAPTETEQPMPTRSLRGKRKLESDPEAEDKPNLKKTRGGKKTKIEADSNNTNEGEIKTAADKKTRKTRQAKQKDDSIKQPTEESINTDKVEIKTTVEKKARKTRQAKQKDDPTEQPTEESNNTGDSEIKTIVEKKTRKTRQAKQKDDSVEQPTEETKTKPRRGKKAPELKEDSISNENNEEVKDEKTKRPTKGRKETKKGTSVEEETTKTTRSRRGKLQVETSDIVEDTTSNKKGKSNKQEEGEQESTNVDNQQLEAKKTTRNNKKVEIAEESIDTENKPKPTQRGRKKKIAENEEITKDLENEVKPQKRGRGNKKVDEKNINIKEESVEIENESSSRKKTKNIRKNETEENKDVSQPSNKKNTRKTKVEDPSPEKNDEHEPQVEKNTRNAKGKVTSDDKEPTKATRTNKGKNKKYADEDWDTPVKKNDKKQTVTFKDDVEYLKTPAESITNGGRSLRSRK